MLTGRVRKLAASFDGRAAVELLFASAASGLTAATFVLAAKGIADLGDLLGFAGAFVGAVMTIGGIIWVERRRSGEIESRDRLHLVNCVRRIETLASLTTSWLREFETEPLTRKSVTALSLIIQIQSAFSESYVILNSLQQATFIRAKWSARVIVNLEWLKNRIEEGLKIVQDSRFTESRITTDSMAAKEYVLSVQHVCTTTLVLSWRLLLILGEQPCQTDQSRIAIDSAVVVQRHEAGLDF